MYEFEIMKQEKKEDFVVEMSKTYSAAMEGYMYSVEMYSEIAYAETHECVIRKTLKGAENKYSEWVRTHITN